MLLGAFKCLDFFLSVEIVFTILTFEGGAKSEIELMLLVSESKSSVSSEVTEESSFG